MVHEEYIDHQYRSSSVKGEARSSGPTKVRSTVLDISTTQESASAPDLAELSDLMAARESESQPQLSPWWAAAQAKGRPGYFLAKRCLDGFLALIALVALSPVFLALVLLVRLTSRGPAFFRQERVGYAGRRFTMLKFRSMYIESDEQLHRLAYEKFLRGEHSHGKVDGGLLANGQQDEAEGAAEKGAAAKAKRKPSGDPRVTRVGDLLRRTSLDELPQFLNVLRGDMSLVGPRPPIPYEVELYQPWHMERLNTLPGITGIWQIYGRGRVPFDRMVQMDIEYIEKQSFWYDLKLLILTIPAVLHRKGAV